MLGMHPIVDELMACKPLALSNFLFLMGKDIIHTAAMYVKMLAKVLHRHSATFDMPARKTGPPGTIPRHLAPGFGRFPQREIFKVVPISIYPLAYSRQHILQLVAGELPVLRKAFNVEVDVAVDLIGNALCQQTLDDSDHLRDVLCRTWENRRRFNIEFPLILVERPGIELCNLCRCFALFACLCQYFILTAIHHLLPHMTHIG